MAGLALGGVLRDTKVIYGLKNTLEASADVIRSAERSLTGELFILYADNAVHDALAAKQPGLDALFLADPEMISRGSIQRGVLDAMGAKVVQHGEMPNKIHAKALIADGEHGIISTGAWYSSGGSRNEWLDLAVTVRGDAARAVENLTRTAATGDKASFAKAAHEAAQHGVYINDPSMGVLELGPQVRHMIASAKERLIIATKRTDSPEVEGMLQAARDRGVEVIRYDRGATGKTLHGNVIVADDHAYIGSGMLNNRTLKGSGSSGRMARELGVVIQGSQVEDVVRNITTKIDEAEAAKAVKDAEKAARKAAEAAAAPVADDAARVADDVVEAPVVEPPVVEAPVVDAPVVDARVAGEGGGVSRRTLVIGGASVLGVGGAAAGYAVLR